MTVGIVMTVWNNKHAHRRNLLGTVVTMPTVITLSPTLSLLSFNNVIMVLLKNTESLSISIEH